jgi:F-type H+-transporting ATPase subunit delta
MTADVSSKYAKALFFLNPAPNELKAQVKELGLIVSKIEAPLVMSFLASSLTSEKKKEELIKKAVNGRNLKPELISFLTLLIHKGRIHELPSIYSCYKDLVNEQLKREDAKLITPVPVSQDILHRLKDKLEKEYNLEIDIVNEIDLSLIGGGILLIGNQMIDFSFKNKLNQLKDDLLSITV